ncbi:MAG: hypothetical protein CL565_05330 [Alphaproteobacteria bacterium]|nr:hypothetical protein [Alphaproteobacteria bacterium]
MVKITDIKTNFTAGEVSRQLLGRGDLRAYENGALALRNLFIFPTGGVTRRAGLYYVDTVPGEGRLVSFEFNTQQTYLIVLTDMQIDIYLQGTKVATLSSPWNTNQISELVWTQSADTLLMVHPDVPPKKLFRTVGGSWGLSEWSFFADEGIIYQPMYKFANSEVTLTPSGTSGSITLTSSADVFEADHLGTRLRIGGKNVEIDSVNSATVVSVITIEDLENTDATIDWDEQAFSPVRGYPASVAFHQDRLVLGGSRDLPNRLWFSKSGDLFNFDLGEGLDDEAIEFAILSDQVNAIRAVFSGRHLQVFTSGAEWMVTGNPLTPETVQLNRQTRVGSVIDRYIPPIDVDGATLFVARNKQEIREFLYTDIEQAYQSTDLALLSRHIITNPVDQDFDQKRRLLFIVREDGQFATLTVYRAEAVAAWTLHETLGHVKSVSVVGEEVYLLIERNGNHTIEQFDDTVMLDSALEGEAGNPTTTWSGLDHLEGQEVYIMANGVVHDARTVLNGAISLSEPASHVQIGLPFTHMIEPLPPAAVEGAGAGRSVRLVEAVFRLENTAALNVDLGRGLKAVSLKPYQGEITLGEPPAEVSGDIRVRAFGWRENLNVPLWRVEQDLPLPFTLLAVSMELSVNN